MSLARHGAGPLRAPALACAVAGAILVPPGAAAAVDPWQRQAPAAPAAAPTAHLGGVVLGAPDRRPLPRARVLVQSPGLPAARVAITGPDGRFAIPHLPAGTYAITVACTGFAPQAFGSDTPGSAGEPGEVELRAGQHRDGLEIVLLPGGSISGRVFDEDGSPFAGAYVEAVRPLARNGTTRLMAFAADRTDDRGEFRLFGLPAGQYYVTATDPSLEDVGDASGPIRYLPTYYPGAIVPEAATRVAVAPPRDTPAIELRLRILKPAVVSGRIAAFDGKPLLGAALVMSPEHRGAVAVSAPGDVTIEPDGRFTFRNVPPGRYVIRARGETERAGASLFGTFAITVGGRDVPGVNVTLGAGATLEGVMVLDPSATPRPDLSSLRVRAPMADGAIFGDSFTGGVKADGTFELRGVMAGAHVLVVDGLPPSWALASAQHRGREYADEVLDLEGGAQLSGLQIVVTGRTAMLSGIVADEEGHPAPGCTVAVFPTDRARWHPHNRHIKLVRTDARGRYRLEGLPPADYYVRATADLFDSDLHDRATLERLAIGAQRVSLADGSSHLRDLKLLTIPSGLDTSTVSGVERR
jgi:protocatechuate 3,4-dioxygenase beta subunit